MHWVLKYGEKVQHTNPWKAQTVCIETINHLVSYINGEFIREFHQKKLSTGSGQQEFFLHHEKLILGSNGWGATMFTLQLAVWWLGHFFRSLRETTQIIYHGMLRIRRSMFDRDDEMQFSYETFCVKRGVRASAKSYRILFERKKISSSVFALMLAVCIQPRS